jgi:hypothetical protein
LWVVRFFLNEPCNINDSGGTGMLTKAGVKKALSEIGFDSSDTAVEQVRSFV